MLEIHVSVQFVGLVKDLGTELACMTSIWMRVLHMKIVNTFGMEHHGADMTLELGFVIVLIGYMFVKQFFTSVRKSA